MTPEDACKVRRVCINLAMATYTGIDYFECLPLWALIETAKEVADIGKQKRLRNSDKDSRRGK